jgi:hypothetical protein
MKRIGGFLVPALILLSGTVLWATNYYVANWGSDSYRGLSWDSAFATLQHAANQVAAGDSVRVANGDYAGFDLRTPGAAGLPIVFQGAGDSVRITADNGVTTDGINVEDADWAVIDGFRVIGRTRAGIRVAVAQHVAVRNNVCDNNGRWGIFTGFADYALIENNVCSYSQAEHGIYFSNSADHPVIRHNISHHNHGCGIHMNGDASMGGDGLITDATVEGNIAYENGAGGGSGINCDGVADSRIYNNLLYLNHASGISLYRIDAAQGSFRDEIFNNTVLNAADGRWCLNISDASTADTIYNNVFINLHSWRGSIAIDSASQTGFFSDYNIVMDRMSADGGNTRLTLAQWRGLGYDGHSQLADSLDSIFVNWPGGDYHLRPGAQAVDSGTALVAGIVTDDLDGLARPQGNGFDIGAYEYHAGRIGEADERPDDPAAGDRMVRKGQFLAFPEVGSGALVRIYDCLGRTIVTLTGRPGSGAKWWTGAIPKGVYFYIATAAGGDRRAGGKILVY